MLFLHARTGYGYLFFLCIGIPHPVVGFKRSRCIVINAPVNALWNDKLQDVRRKKINEAVLFLSAFLPDQSLFPRSPRSEMTCPPDKVWREV